MHSRLLFYVFPLILQRELGLFRYNVWLVQVRIVFVPNSSACHFHHIPLFDKATRSVIHLFGISVSQLVHCHLCHSYSVEMPIITEM